MRRTIFGADAGLAFTLALVRSDVLSSAFLAPTLVPTLRMLRVCVYKGITIMSKFIKNRLPLNSQNRNLTITMQKNTIQSQFFAENSYSETLQLSNSW